MKIRHIILALSLAAASLNPVAAATDYVSCRPPAELRKFHSPAVEAEIERVQALLKCDKLAWMFGNCFPNTLDTTVGHRIGADGLPDTFVITGDIPAMWLRDSSAQVWPYLTLMAADEGLRSMVEGLIRRQLRCILSDPYANAFNDGPDPDGQWMADLTDMKPELHERKWEIDSLCYPLRLAWAYWKLTGDSSVFDSTWVDAVRLILATFTEQQRKDGRGPYSFRRVTDRALDSQILDGYGAPASGCGLIVSSFRPSDDATLLPYLVPSNFFAVSVLRKAAEILDAVNGEHALAADCRTLAAEVEEALRAHAVVRHPEFGEVYAYEVDGFGSCLLMDDANVPSLLSLPYISDVAADDPVYLNTRRMVWSRSNPYFCSGSAAEGIGGPHVGVGMAWPMSIMMRAFTTSDDAELRECMAMLLATDAGTGFIHESFDVDDPARFTRPWFAWQNTLFGELVLKIIADGKLELLNSL